MATTIVPASAPSSGQKRVKQDSVPASPPPKSGYLVGSWFDFLFICNLYWPLLLLLDSWGGIRTHESLLFWQVFFVTTPHRWITLFLVFGDSEKRSQGLAKFTMVTLLIVGSVSMLWLSIGSLLCLMAVDYIWNAWHFAAQHHGIYRIYARKGKVSTTLWNQSEKWIFRCFVLYVIARVAGWSWSSVQFVSWIGFVDYAVLGLAAGLVLLQAISRGRENPTGVLYAASVMTLYSSLLLAVHFQSERLVLQLALASALFHAVEYLAIVSWSMRSSRVQSRQDLFGYVGSRWLIYLAVFAIVLGASAWALEHGAFKFWAAINLMAAFLHYSFDGIIWKKPAKATASKA